MYGLPPDFDPHRLVGYTLVMIGLGTGTLVLNFSRPQAASGSKHMRIAIGSKAHFAVAGKSGQIAPRNPAEGAQLVDFLNHDITDAAVLGKGDLVLRFGAIGEVTIHEDDSGFESYTLFLEGELPIVV